MMPWLGPGFYFIFGRPAVSGQENALAGYERGDQVLANRGQTHCDMWCVQTATPMNPVAMIMAAQPRIGAITASTSPRHSRGETFLIKPLRTNRTESDLAQVRLMSLKAQIDDHKQMLKPS
jgi:hypothetical protein